jgi:hypothetical protein
MYEAEKKMWRAVIDRALSDAVMKGINMRDKKRACRWLFNDDPDFEIVCGLADIEPDVVRRNFFKSRKPVKK